MTNFRGLQRKKLMDLQSKEIYLNKGDFLSFEECQVNPNRGITWL